MNLHGPGRRFIGHQSPEASNAQGPQNGSEHVSTLRSPSMRRTPSNASNASCEWRAPAIRRSRSCASDASIDWVGTSAILRSRSLASDTSLDGNATVSVSPGSAIIEACAAPTFFLGSPYCNDSPRCSRQVIPLSPPKDRPRSASPTLSASQRQKYVWHETSLPAFSSDQQAAESGNQSVADLTRYSAWNGGVETRTTQLSSDPCCLHTCQGGGILPPRDTLVASVATLLSHSPESQHVLPCRHANAYQKLTPVASRLEQKAASGINANNFPQDPGSELCLAARRKCQSGPLGSRRTTPTRSYFSQRSNRTPSASSSLNQPAPRNVQARPRPQSAPRSGTRSQTPRKVSLPGLAATSDRVDARNLQTLARDPICTTFRLYEACKAQASLSTTPSGRAPLRDPGRAKPASSAGAAGKVAKAGQGVKPRRSDECEASSRRETTAVAARFQLVQANADEPRKAGEISLF